MGAHAAPARHRRSRTRPPGGAADRHPLRRALPAALAVVYGLYAGFLHRGDGPTDWGDVLFALAAAVVFGALCLGLARVQRRLPREARGLAYGALGGTAIGFLYSVSGGSLLASAVLGLIVGAAFFCAAFYVFYTHE
ncbi:hypothetical protein [Streptomyces sp. DH12]|uniref:hypothetical protein n=1 Tax=Streptomyces sp. DH12 TaxID=2857010 RepID=UPI001E425E38|nr:hypothetical protein [Streptomyces sp. DH12]